LAKETWWSLVNKGFVFVSFYVVNYVLARQFGVELYGQWSFLWALLSIISVFSFLGINTSAKKFFAEHLDTPKLQGVYKYAFYLRTIGSLSILSFYAFVVVLCYFTSALEKDQLFLLVISAPLVILLGYIDWYREFFLGIHRIFPLLVLNLIDYFLKLLLIFLFLSRLNIPTVVLVFVCSSIACVTYAYFWSRNYFLSSEGGCFLEGSIKKSIKEYSYPIFFMTVGFVLISEIDTVMIGMLSNDEAVGRYALAKQIVCKIPHLSLAIAAGVMPVFAKLTTGDELVQCRKLFRKVIICNTLLVVPVLIAVFVFGGQILSLVGPDYSGSLTSLRILTLYVFFVSASAFLSSFLDYAGLAKKRAKNLIVAIVLNIFLNMMLIPKYGAVGAATATLMSYLPYFYLNVLEVRRSFSVQRT
jgi:O-antigen/teichoic acid export membrane protein